MEDPSKYFSFKNKVRKVGNDLITYKFAVYFSFIISSQQQKSKI